MTKNSNGSKICLEPLVTVVIPTIAREELVRAVRSVAIQNVPTEIIVVLDKPAAERTVRNLLRDFDYVLLMTSGGDGGAVARNVGLRAATAPYLAYLDDDDEWMPGKLKVQLDAISSSSDPSQTLVVTASSFVRSDGKSYTLPKHKYDPSLKIADYLVDRRELKFGRHFMQTSSIFGPTKFLSEYEWDESLQKHQDWDLLTRIISTANNRLVQLDSCYVRVYQETANSVSKKPNWEASWFWYQKHREGMGAVGRGDFLTTQILRSSLHTRSFEGIRCFMSNIREAKPHISAVIVGMCGLIKR